LNEEVIRKSIARTDKQSSRFPEEEHADESRSCSRLSSIH
jgi:hypothetical protein